MKGANQMNGIRSNEGLKLKRQLLNLIMMANQAFWQGAQVQNRTIRSNPHNNAQSEKIRKILHNTEMFTWNLN